MLTLIRRGREVVHFEQYRGAHNSGTGRSGAGAYKPLFVSSVK